MVISKNTEELSPINALFPTCSVEKSVFNGIIYCSSEVIRENVGKGLCINCAINDQCTWIENNKIFCEHYQ